MKKINFLILVFLVFNTITFCQNNIIDVNSGNHLSAPAGSYLKDINNTFDKIVGTWKWQEGNRIIIFKIEKVSMYHNLEHNFDKFVKKEFGLEKQTLGLLNFMKDMTFINNNSNKNPFKLLKKDEGDNKWKEQKLSDNRKNINQIPCN